MVPEQGEVCLPGVIESMDLPAVHSGAARNRSDESGLAVITTIYCNFLILDHAQGAPEKQLKQQAWCSKFVWTPKIFISMLDLIISKDRLTVLRQAVSWRICPRYWWRLTLINKELLSVFSDTIPGQCGMTTWICFQSGLSWFWTGRNRQK